jgi:hypothetical protein
MRPEDFAKGIIAITKEEDSIRTHIGSNLVLMKVKGYEVDYERASWG